MNRSRETQLLTFINKILQFRILNRSYPHKIKREQVEVKIEFKVEMEVKQDKVLD